MKFSYCFAIISCLFIEGVLLPGCSAEPEAPILDQAKLAQEYFKEDAQWYMDNIPFFDCSDKEMEQVYYYRWKMYKAHIRNTGPNNYVITEFINHVAWDREPWCTINAASMHHIYEGRWLKDDRYINGYINYLYQQGGNDRRYSESIADASYARYLVNADSTFLMQQLDSMQQQYMAWYDHYDSSKNMFYIPAMPDATEYTIASIDGSGGKDGFEGGEAFRPTINSYMYGNALAIARIAAMKGNSALSNEYLQKAAALKTLLEQNLWNDSLQHFTDRYKIDNQFVHYWNFIRGRELAGLAPWYFNLPADTAKYSIAWKQVTDTSRLLGVYGLRTNEPSYEYYFKQFVFYQGQRGSQWNGPSWPYQSSMMITGIANLLNNYHQQVVAVPDYLKLLRQFTKQHYLPNGKINLVENYDPNLGGPIVYYYWSNHYNHSSYNNLIISGLCGIRPSEGDTLVINPLVDESIQYFCLDDVRYHGHKLTVVYDKDGTQYNRGKGLTVLVDGKKAALFQHNGKTAVAVGAPVINHPAPQPANVALNIAKNNYPAPSASVNAVPDSLFQAIDGRIWYFPEITNRWTTAGSTATNDWYELDFGQPRAITTINIYPVSDNETFAVPDSISLQYQNGKEWWPLIIKTARPAQLTGNTVNSFQPDKILATRLRINFKHGAKQVAISEIECY